MTETQAAPPCTACGGAMAYDPAADALKCPFCGAVEPIEQSSPWERAEAVRELDYEAALAAARGEGAAQDGPAQSARVIPCPGCGAETMFDPEHIARACPWCATPLSAAPVTHETVRPRAMLPFLVDRQGASEAMRAWLSGRWFAPSGLAKYARDAGRLDGLHTPCWTFDADTLATYSGMRGDHYYVTRQVPVQTDKGTRMETRQERRTRWRPASGQVQRSFDDVLRPATPAVEAAEFDRLGGWDLSALVPVDPRYMAGFLAETHSTPLERGFAEARAVMRSAIEHDVRRDIGGDEQRITDLQISWRQLRYKPVLLPIWLAAYRWKGKAYRVAVNGRTGMVTGDRPWSAWKIAAAVLAALALAAAAFWLAGLSDGTIRIG